MKFSPTYRILIFFISLISIGTLLLLLPFSYTSTKPYFVDALFTATSATCVTGLTVVSTKEFWTFWGQIVILCLIQLGGLGYISFAVLLGILAGRISLKEKMALKEVVDFSTFSNLLQLLKKIIIIVVFFEIVGALMLSGYFLSKGVDVLMSIYNGVFHSVSAFCNAGFSIFPDNLASFKSNPFVILTISFLIIIGGIGFIVIMEMKNLKNLRKLSAHTKLALLTTFFLILSAFLCILSFEWANTLKELSIGNKILNAFFHSITPRTAGFNTLNITEMKLETIFLTICLMFIGGSPTGTAGGIKTTTFAIIIVSLVSALKGKSSVVVFKKTILDDTVKKSYIIAILSLFIVLILLVFLLIFEEFDFLKLLFEGISAFGTVGLSTGITPNLSSIGKIFLIFLMFAGRIGLLCLGSVVLFSKKFDLKYPEARIIVG